MDPVTAQLALALAAQGLRAWANFSERASAGEVTRAELDAMSEKLGMNIAKLEDEILAARSAGTNTVAQADLNL